MKGSSSITRIRTADLFKAYWREASTQFPVLLLTGPRQVGKTTLLRHLSGANRRYVTLDDLAARELARRDPVLFLQKYKPPVLIDEVHMRPKCSRRSSSRWIATASPARSG